MNVMEARVVLTGICRQASALEAAFKRSMAAAEAKMPAGGNRALLVSAASQGAEEMADVLRSLEGAILRLEARNEDDDANLDATAVQLAWANSSQSALIHLDLLGHHEGTA